MLRVSTQFLRRQEEGERGEETEVSGQEFSARHSLPGRIASRPSLSAFVFEARHSGRAKNDSSDAMEWPSERRVTRKKVAERNLKKKRHMLSG